MPELTAQTRVLHPAIDALAIYFPEAFCAQWHECIGKLSSALVTLEHASQRRTSNAEADRLLLVRAVDENMNALRSIKSGLRREIRKLLGVE